MKEENRYDRELLELLSNERFQDLVKHGEVPSDVFDLLNKTYSVDLIDQASQLLSVLSPSSIDRSTEITWSKLEQHLILEDLVIQSAPQEPVLKSRFTALLKYAAVITVLFVSSWFISKRVTASNTVVYNTSFNEQRTIQLPDHSTIILNANSQLEVFQDWDDSEDREVRLLKGEAYFKVSKQRTSEHPKFRVSSPHLTVEVLGTQFNINSRRSKTEVALVEGLVSISMDDQEIKIMKPEEVFSVQGGKVITSSKLHAKDIALWLDHKMTLDGVTLFEMAQHIEDNYGFKVSVAPSLSTKKLSGQLHSENLNDLLTVIEESLDLKITRQKSTIQITPKR